MLKCLNNPDVLIEEPHDSFFKMPSKNALVSIAKSLYIRLFEERKNDDDLKNDIEIPENIEKKC